MKWGKYKPSVPEVELVQYREQIKQYVISSNLLNYFNPCSILLLRHQNKMLVSILQSQKPTGQRYLIELKQKF